MEQVIVLLSPCPSPLPEDTTANHFWCDIYLCKYSLVLRLVFSPKNVTTDLPKLDT